MTPFLLLLFLMVAVFVKMVSSPYSFCDDLTHYFSLHQYINEGTPIKTTGGERFTVHSVLFGIKMVYIPIARLLHCLGADYPFIAASKFWGFVMIPLSFGVWAVYLKRNIGPVMGAWAAFAIILFNNINHIIPAGLARSFNVFLLGLWVIALQSRSMPAIIAVLFGASALYPMIVPVMGVSLFFATVWAWRDKEPLLRRAMILGSGFIASVIYMAAKHFINARNYLPHLMSYEEMLEFLSSGVFSSNLNIPRLAGRLADQSLVEWFQFNVFNYWKAMASGSEHMIVACIVGICACGLVFRKTNLRPVRTLIIILAVAIPVIGGFTAAMDRDLFLGSSWFFALAGLAWFCIKDKSDKQHFPLELKLMLQAAVVAFFLVVLALASTSYFYLVHDPGRHLQKPFAVIAPVLAVMWTGKVFAGKQSGRIAATIGVLLALYALTSFSLGYHKYVDEKVMRTLRNLPAGSMILAHPQTADFILIMAGQGASTAHELVRICVQPYTSDLIAGYAKDVDVLYSDKRKSVENWCRQSPGNRFILVEEKIYTQKAVSRLFGPYNLEMEKRRQAGYYLVNLQSPCKIKINETTSLIACDCFLEE